MCDNSQDDPCFHFTNPTSHIAHARYLHVMNSAYGVMTEQKYNAKLFDAVLRDATRKLYSPRELRIADIENSAKNLPEISRQWTCTKRLEKNK